MDLMGKMSSSFMKIGYKIFTAFVACDAGARGSKNY
jgi:hypothetical protein